jgi:hypothetical protein
MKEKGSAGYEASTCFMAGCVSEQYRSRQSMRSWHSNVLSAFVHIVDTESYNARQANTRPIEPPFPKHLPSL